MYSDQVSCLNVLVVDGNYVNTMILTKNLKLFHFNVQVCSGKDTVKSIRKNKYDIAFIYHKLPDMSGTEVTEAIRKLRRNKNKIIIYILADFVTEEISEQYRISGANKVFEQPLKMELFLKDVNQYFPDMDLFVPIEDQKHISLKPYEWCKIKTAFQAVNEIDLESGAKNSMGNHVLFVQIVQSALKEMSAFLLMISSQDKISIEEIKKRLHSLKGVLPYIGANNFTEDTRKLEADLKLGYYMAAIERFKDYIRQLKALLEKLQKALENYNILLKLNEEEITEEANCAENYEQCIRKAIYYIKRFEFDHILQELDKLTRIDDRHIEIYQKVTKSIREFDYEGALELLFSSENNEMSKILVEKPILDRGEAR